MYVTFERYLLMAYLKFCFKLYKPALEMHNTAFRDKVMGKKHTFERFSWLKYGESLVEDCGCSGSSSIHYTVQYVMKIHKIVNESCNTSKGCWQVRPLVWYMPANSMKDLEHVTDLHDICASAAHCGQVASFGQQKHSLGLPTYLLVRLAACDLFPIRK